jgi:hypothetical protein
MIEQIQHFTAEFLSRRVLVQHQSKWTLSAVSSAAATAAAVAFNDDDDDDDDDHNNNNNKLSTHRFSLFDPRTAVATPRLGLRVQFRCISCSIFVEQDCTPYSAWSRVLPEKLTGPESFKKFPAFYGTRRFVTAFTTACLPPVPVLSEPDCT